jgi:capsular polysaccharide biosynthesis protein
MELKEYIQIIKKDKSLFVGTILLAVLAVFVYHSLKPVSYATSLTLEITRKGAQTTADYKFDDFYRLQADERFGETIVQWLKSPAVVSKIFQTAGLDSSGMNLRALAGLIKADKLSSQLVSVSFSTKNMEESQKIYQAISKVLNDNTEKLNIEQKQDNWFIIKAQEPVIIKNKNNSLLSFLASLLAGMFIGFWAVLIRHYLK